MRVECDAQSRNIKTNPLLLRARSAWCLALHPEPGGGTISSDSGHYSGGRQAPHRLSAIAGFVCGRLWGEQAGTKKTTLCATCGTRAVIFLNRLLFHHFFCRLPGRHHCISPAQLGWPMRQRAGLKFAGATTSRGRKDAVNDEGCGGASLFVYGPPKGEHPPRPGLGVCYRLALAFGIARPAGAKRDGVSTAGAQQRLAICSG